MAEGEREIERGIRRKEAHEDTTVATVELPRDGSTVELTRPCGIVKLRATLAPVFVLEPAVQSFMYIRMERSHRVKHLCPLVSDVNDGEKPVNVVVVDGDDNLVQAEDIHMGSPPTDCVVVVAPTFRQPVEEVCVCKPASWVTGGSRLSSLRTSSNLLAPPLQPERDHLAIEPHTVLEASHLCNSDVQTILVRH